MGSERYVLAFHVLAGTGLGVSASTNAAGRDGPIPSRLYRTLYPDARIEAAWRPQLAS